MSLQDQSWWPGLVDRLRLEPLAVLARNVGVSMEDLCAELASVGADGPAQLAPWWPEAKRLLKNTPIREIARRFHTNPRRIRRAAARSGLRVGGREVSARGLLDLMSFREQLGRVPDWRIARASGVPVEAVQGERRRHRIPAFRPPLGYKQGTLSADEEAWILGPVKPRRERMRADSNRVNIVRRPGMRDEAEARPVEAPRPVETRPEPKAEERVRRIVRPEARPEARPEPARPETRPDSRRVGRAPVPDSFFQERDRKNLDSLLAVPKPVRDGRKRIVRVDSPEPVARPVELVPPVRKPRTRKELGWRKVDDAVVAALEEAAAQQPVEPPPAPVAPVARPVSRPSRTVRAPVPTPAPAPVVRPVETRSPSRWRVESGTLVLIFTATDLLDAANQLQRLLPPAQLNQASLQRL